MAAVFIAQQMCSEILGIFFSKTWVVRRDDVDGEHWRTIVCVNNSQSICHQLLKIGEERAKLE